MISCTSIKRFSDDTSEVSRTQDFYICSFDIYGQNFAARVFHIHDALNIIEGR
jgi:hypothetical protein